MQPFSILKMASVAIALCAATAISSPAQTVTTLADFSISGYSPIGDLVQGFNGEFYGVTLSGPGRTGVGTAFDVTSSGKLSLLNRFQSYYGQNWLGYQGGLMLAANGNFYSSAPQGGTNGAGVIYELTPEGKLNALYNFCSQSNSQGDCADGGDPNAGVIQAANGNFYGTAYDGGVSGDFGTIFELTPAGALTTLYTFCLQNGCFDGQNPAGLLQAQDGNFYGITTTGGANGPYGTVFKMNAKGVLTTLHSFCSQKNVVEKKTECEDGYESGTLVQGANGNFYGTTLYGGNYTSSGCTSGGCGTVFEITPAGKLTTLHEFNGSDGDVPNSLLLATDGNIYGTANLAGGLGGGTIFQITPQSQFTVLYTFGSFISPSGLMQATDGNFYGTTVSGGSSCSCGTFFTLSMGLPQFVKTVPGAAKVGSKITILGNGLTGTTSVTFNGAAAAFTVVSDTEIKVAVPAEATSGTIQVVTPSQTLISNAAFRVMKQTITLIAS